LILYRLNMKTIEVKKLLAGLKELRQGKYKSKPKNKWEAELEKIYREDCATWNHVLDLVVEKILEISDKQL